MSVPSKLRHRLAPVRDRVVWVGFTGARQVFIKLLNRTSLGRDQLQRKAEQTGVWIEFGTETSYEIDPPDAGVGPQTTVAPHTGTYTISQPFVAAIPEATVLGRYPFALTGGRVIDATVISRNNAAVNFFKSMAQPGSFVCRTEPIEEAVVLYNAWNDNYFHWVTETLSRLECVRAYEQATDRQPSLLVGPELTAFQRETLALLGYEESALIHWSGGRSTVDRLVIPAPRREMNDDTHSPVAIDWLREQLLPQATPPSDAERIYVSRADADKRRVTNEEAVMDCLESYGFERIVPSTLSVAETIGYFAQAELIVGPHGAGLTDLIFSGDAAVIELARGAPNTRVYWLLSKQVDNWYAYLEAEPAGPDMTVAIDQLERLLAKAIDRS